MHLKGVEIYGFKSFGERINIDFNRGITSIVGPNGSGKSNIMDAVLWVLGEQSYKNIRAKDSSDVIFSGAGKNSNHAEVSLYIDNGDEYFEGYGEIIKITRKIQKNGDNDYYINDKKSRLKDISTLFMDTGIGKSAYSVIGQGKVERIISSSNKEIKQIIEEAAGIKKFQMNKQESLKNLKSINDELEKLSLVMNQVEENKNNIGKQAVKAKEYLSIKNEKELLEKGVLIFDFNKKTKTIDKLNNEKIETIATIKDIENKIEINDNSFERNELEREKLEKGINEVQDKNTELREIIEKNQREKARILERIEGLERESTEKSLLMEKIELKIQGEKDSIIHLKMEEENIGVKILSMENENEKASKEIEEIEREKKEQEIEQEVKKRKLMDLEVEKLKMVNDIENSTRRAKSSEAKLVTLKNDYDSFLEKIKALKENQREKNEKYSHLETELKKTVDRIEFLENEISKKSITLNSKVERLRDVEYEDKRTQMKYQNILRLEESNEGLFKGVKEVLNRNIKGVHGIVASLINIPEGLEKAIEAAISGNLQDIVVETAQVAKEGIEVLKETGAGRASFLALDTVKPPAYNKKWLKENGVLGIASTLVKTQEKYQKIVDSLLGTLLVIDDFQCGIEILKRGEHQGNIVTTSGELLSSRGRITGGENKNSVIGQLLERKKEKRVLEEQIEKIGIEKTTLSKEIEDIKLELERYEGEIFQIDAKEDNNKKELKRIQEELEDIKVRVERTERDLLILSSEYENEKNYIEEFSKKVDTSQNEKELLEKEIIRIRDDIDRAGVKITEISEKIRVKKELYSDVRINYLNLINRKDQIKSDCEKYEREFIELERELEGSKKRIVEISNTQEKAKIQINELEDELNEKSLLYNKENNEITKMKERIAVLSSEERSLITEKKELESKIIKIRDKNIKEIEQLDKISYEIERIKENLENLISVEEIELNDENYDESRNRFKTLENKLKNFETVNLLAIEEFEILEKKYSYLNGQYTDIDTSRKTLVQLIDEISQEIETRFENAHNEISSNFNEMCGDILMNSEGKLLLTKGENLEDAGIDIVVKFKNKKQQSLSLFSGGEKSMVAIAFVMAIFLYKPSPFTFLDEIEAALDDKNTRKLINKLKEFTEKSQFILITHNKETMRESDSIFGVTMNKEIGISKIVPVKF